MMTKVKAPLNPVPGEVYLTSQQASRYLGLHPGTLKQQRYEARKKGIVARLPYIEDKGGTWYAISDLDKALAGGFPQRYRAPLIEEQPKDGKPVKIDLERYMPREEAAKLLGLGIGTLYHVRAHLPPRCGPGRRYYDREKLLAVVSRMMAPNPGAMPPPKDMNNPETLLTTKEAAACLGWKMNRLQSDRQYARENDTSPKVRYLVLPDNRVRYALGDVLAVKAKEL